MAEEYEIVIEPASCREVWCFSHAHADEDHVFLCQVAQDVAPVLHEGAAFAWMTRDEITALALGFDQIKILPHVPT